MLKYTLVLMLLALPAISLGHCQITYRVADFPPYMMQDTQDNWTGLDVELAKAVFDEAQCEVKYTLMPWKRGLHLLKHGGVDMISGLSFNRERDKYTYFIGPMRDESIGLIVDRDSQYQLTELEDLKSLPKRIGYLRGVYYGASFAEKYQSDTEFAGKFETADNEDTNWLKLQNRRLSAIATDKYNGIYKLRLQNIDDNYKVHKFLLNQDVVYFGFSRKAISQETINRLRAALQRLQKNGDLDRIKAKYN
ncbi:MAG: transporter substrate-binding domain-containing protein [Pseudomonadales bacterium]|nr:transporter substrate-binding domain-containing protein [Pseudomonadales bacterium]